MSYEIDELKLQRLVDGVLDDAGRSAFLKELDGHPEAWREVALAFVEEQIFAAELPATAGAAGVPVVLPSPRPSGLRLFARAAGLAAGLVMAVVAGFQWGQDRGVAAPGGAAESVAAQSVGEGEGEGISSGEFEERLKKLGYRLEKDARFVQGSLEDGSPVLVPVRSMQMAYHGV